MTIHIHLHGDPGFRTGTATIGDERFELVTWHRQAGGEVHATTTDGQQVTLALSNGRGGITIGTREWLLDSCVWAGTEMTGQARRDVWFEAFVGRLEAMVRG